MTQTKQWIKEVQIVAPVVIDDLDNAVWCTYGPASNIAYLLNSDGTIKFKQIYYDPTSMEQQIKDLLAKK